MMVWDGHPGAWEVQHSEGGGPPLGLRNIPHVIGEEMSLTRAHPAHRKEVVVLIRSRLPRGQNLQIRHLGMGVHPRIPIPPAILLQVVVTTTWGLCPPRTQVTKKRVRRSTMTPGAPSANRQGFLRCLQRSGLVLAVRMSASLETRSLRLPGSATGARLQAGSARSRRSRLGMMMPSAVPVWH